MQSPRLLGVTNEVGPLKKAYLKVFVNKAIENVPEPKPAIPGLLSPRHVKGGVDHAKCEVNCTSLARQVEIRCL